MELNELYLYRYGKIDFFIYEGILYDSFGDKLNMILLDDPEIIGVVAHSEPDIYPDGFISFRTEDPGIYDPKTNLIYPYSCIQYVDDKVDLCNIQHFNPADIENWIILNQNPKTYSIN